MQQKRTSILTMLIGCLLFTAIQANSAASADVKKADKMTRVATAPSVERDTVGLTTKKVDKKEKGKKSDEQKKAARERKSREKNAEEQRAKAEAEARLKAILEAREKREAERLAEIEQLRSDPEWKATHKEVAVIKVLDGEQSIMVNNYCLDTDGNLLVACGGTRITYEQSETASQRDINIINEETAIRVYSPQGRLIKTWPLDFAPQAICVSATGVIFAAGEGRVAQINQAGEVVKVADTPNVGVLEPLPEVPEADDKPLTEEEQAIKDKKIEKLTKRVAKAREAQRKSQQEILKLKDADARKVAFEKQQAAMAKYIKASQALRELTIGPRMIALQNRHRAMYKRAVTGIAVTGDDLYVCCPMAESYGFAVWRMNLDLGKAKQIVENLRGCCGQMDIQATNGELWVPENARHQVTRYDRNGEELAKFGKRGRNSVDSFGGCCEPKNIRFSGDGVIFTAESGPPMVVKKWSTEGEFLGVAGIPSFQTGCVRVTVEVSKDGRFIYILNTGENQIHVLEKKPEESDDE